MNPTKGRRGGGYDIPVNISVVFASRRKVGQQFYAGKNALLPPNRADEAYGALHATRHVDNIADGQVLGRRLSRGERRHGGVV